MTLEEMKARLGPLRPGKEYGARVYPGGRREAGQFPSDILMPTDEAIAELQNGRKVYVALDDLVDVVQRSGIPV